MTPEEVETEIRAAGCGWEQHTDGVVLATNETSATYCNADYCKWLATAGTAAGATPEEVGQAVRAYVDGEPDALREILSP